MKSSQICFLQKNFLKKNFELQSDWFKNWAALENINSPQTFDKTKTCKLISQPAHNFVFKLFYFQP